MVALLAVRAQYLFINSNRTVYPDFTSIIILLKIIFNN
jgi:hypothetical protein